MGVRKMEIVASLLIIIGVGIAGIGIKQAAKDAKEQTKRIEYLENQLQLISDKCGKIGVLDID